MALVIITEHIENTTVYVNKAAENMPRALPASFQPVEIPTSKEADRGTQGFHRVACVGDHMAAALAAATKGDVRTVRQMLAHDFDLDHAEAARLGNGLN
ncbi:hypothetical protein [Sinorhizobium fredii]|uniref:hypothetical protein n=1 Tax=Rhizobium fredii TaxID=380 RepID=UPI0005B4CFFC|nr:hypothetical protein [Sinorhizobium fredii]